MKGDCNVQQRYFERMISNKKNFIINNDLDGILSWLFLEKKGFPIGGIYNNKDIYLRDGIDAEECSGVDMDLFIPSVPSLGHHFVLFSHEDLVNPNSIFGITDREQYQSLRDYQEPPRYDLKCPLSTILLLYWLTGEPLPENKKARDWLLYADSLFVSYRKYKPNVKSWLMASGLESLISDLESRDHLQRMRECASKIQHFGRNVRGRGFNIRKNRLYPQASFRPLDLPLLQPLINFLERDFQFLHEIQIPEDIYNCHRRVSI